MNREKKLEILLREVLPMVTGPELRERIDIALLKWYVENDDTNDAAYNEPWLKQKRAAMKLLGMNQ